MLYIEGSAVVFELVSFLDDDGKINILFPPPRRNDYRGPAGRMENYLLFCRQCTNRKVNTEKKKKSRKICFPLGSLVPSDVKEMVREFNEKAEEKILLLVGGNF